MVRPLLVPEKASSGTSGSSAVSDSHTLHQKCLGDVGKTCLRQSPGRESAGASTMLGMGRCIKWDRQAGALRDLGRVSGQNDDEGSMLRFWAWALLRPMGDEVRIWTKDQRGSRVFCMAFLVWRGVST